MAFKEIYFNLPDKTICDSEILWGCDYNDVISQFNLFKAHAIPRKDGKAWQSFDLGNNITLRIL